MSESVVLVNHSPSRKRPRVEEILDRLKLVHGSGIPRVIPAPRPTQASATAVGDNPPRQNHSSEDQSSNVAGPQELPDNTSNSPPEGSLLSRPDHVPVHHSAPEFVGPQQVLLSLEQRLARLGPSKEHVWNPNQESLDDFLTVASPSMLWSPCQWVVVNNNNPLRPGYSAAPIVSSCNVTPIKNVLKELEAKVHANQSISNAEKKAATQRILQVAQQQRFTLGKWILRFSPSERLDEFWRRLAEHTANGNLGCSTKMAPAKYLRPGSFEKVLCCVYVKDFADTAEVKRVWQALRKLGFGRFGVQGFKPEIFSVCGISSGNSWRLETVIHTFEEALAWGDEETPSGPAELDKLV